MVPGFPGSPGSPSLVIEFQHSSIEEGEVIRRGVDYRLHGRNIIWVIDGGWGVKVSESRCDEAAMYHLFFVSRHKWMYESFRSEDYVYVHVDPYMYRVSPRDVVDGFVQVSERVDKTKFVEALKARTHDALWTATEASPPKTQRHKIYWKQRGAGNGKTYESVHLLDKPEFAHKNVFLYLTKVHSAREMIFQEFLAQASNLKKVTMRPNAEEHMVNDRKAYRIPFTRKSTLEHGIVYIGTVDSFTFNMCSMIPTGSRDLFLDVVKRITAGDIQTDEAGGFSFRNARVSNRTLVIVDEAQDLKPEYVTALAAIMRETRADVALIGDKLQSIWGEENVYTYLEKHDLAVDVERDIGDNRVLRFHNPGLIAAVNAVVPFGKFGLPPIIGGCEREGCKLCEEQNDAEAFHVGLVVEEIPEEMRRLAKERGYLPADFAVIAPILKGKKHLCELERMINQMWLDLGEDEAYMQDTIISNGGWGADGDDWETADHCWMHQSEQGRPIDLTASERSTRILSIHAAKGTGTKIVFVVDMTEENLVKLAGWGSKGGLQYESFVHVAVTRQKKRLYLVYSGHPVQDDIYTRFVKNSQEQGQRQGQRGIAPVPRTVPDPVSYRHALDMLAGEELEAFEKVLNRICDGVEEKLEKCSGPKDNEMQMQMNIFEYTLIRRFHGDSPQLFALSKRMSEIVSYPIVRLAEYGKKCTALKQGSAECVFPILRFAGDGHEDANAEMLQRLVRSVCEKVRESLPKMPQNLCPLEIATFLHILEVMQKGWSDQYRPSSMYRTFREYTKGGMPWPETHDGKGCPCHREFRRGAKGAGEFKRMSSRAIGQHMALRDTAIGGDGKRSTVLYNHMVRMRTDYDNTMKTCLKFVMEVEDESETQKVVIVHVLPKLSTMNVQELVAKVIFDAACLSYPLGHQEKTGKRTNQERYVGKSQEHYIMSMNHTLPVRVSLDGIVDARTVQGWVTQGVREDYKRFIREVVRMRDTSRDGFDEWVKNVGEVGNAPRTIKVMHLASQGATQECLERAILSTLATAPRR